MKILYDSLWSIYSHIVDLSSILHRGSFGGEMARKQGRETENRELKNQGHAGDDGKGQRAFSFTFPVSPSAFFFLQSPALARFTSSLPIPQPTGKAKEISAEEREIYQKIFFGQGRIMRLYSVHLV